MRDIFSQHALALALVSALVVGLAACQRDSTPAGAPQATSPPLEEIPATPAPVELQDVVERDPRYIIGISYPDVAMRYPGLAAELKRYADAARAELMQAVAGIGEQKPVAPYDLSLAFSEIAATPQLVAVAADGSSYTGGAHGNPLIARFVWLPQQDKRLTAAELVPDPKSWRNISDYVREQLHAALSTRIDADEMPAADRAGMIRNAGKMIDEGTSPEPGNFDQFEPVLSADGSLIALRFVFPPYQVGPYADGVQTVEVPAKVLLPEVAPEYRSLFGSK